MIPILYATMTEGTIPTNYGIGCLTDCLSCKVTEERNGAYELEMEYSAEGIHADEIIVLSLERIKNRHWTLPNYMWVSHMPQ